MSDLKLFRTTLSGVAELPGGAMALERSLQTLRAYGVPVPADAIADRRRKTRS